MNKLLKNPNEAEIKKFLEFAEKNSEINKSQMYTKLALFEFIVPVINDSKSDRILEIGCGHGIHGALLTNFGEVDITDLGNTESWMGNVENTREQIIKEFGNNRLRFTENDGYSLPYPDNYFNIVFHNSVIEHVPSIEKFNSEVFRVLKNDGIVICITGTRALCIYRFLRFWLIKQPILFCKNIFKDSTIINKLEELYDKNTIYKTYKFDDKLNPFHSQIFHYLVNPAYNKIIIENLSKEFCIDQNTLLFSLKKHYENNWFQKMKLICSPRTHGQHYKGVFDELRSWSISTWKNSFTDHGFYIEVMKPIRFHYLFEFTFSAKLNAWLYLKGVKIIKLANKFNLLPNNISTEFLLVARKRVDNAFGVPKSN